MKKQFKKVLLLKNYGINKKNLSNIYLNTLINKRLSKINFKQKHLLKINKFISTKLYIKKLNKKKKIRIKTRKKVSKNLKFKIKIKSYIGRRLILKYPIRGQRTHTNAKTARKLRF